VDAPGGRQPKLTVEAQDGAPLASSRALRIDVADPWHDVGAGSITLRFVGVRPRSAVDDSGAAIAIERSPGESSMVLDSASLPRTLSVDARPASARGGGGGGCSIDAARPPGSASATMAASLASFTLAARLRRRRRNAERLSSSPDRGSTR